MAHPKKTHRHKPGGTGATPPPPDNNQPIPTNGPQFGETVPTPDPTKFTIKHGNDNTAWKIIDHTKQYPRTFPVVDGTDEPILKLANVFGDQGASVEQKIEANGQIVFQAVGDTGNIKGPETENAIADKMTADYDDTDPKAVPVFFYHLGDVIYNFGEGEYYYDQFYDVYRDYPGPILAIAGNHDGMVPPKSKQTSLEAFLENFCQAGQPPHRTPEAGGLARTAQVQPAVYFTLEAPFVRILGLYSNCLEDPGVISDENGQFPYLKDTQIVYLKTALARVKSEKFKGAVIIAVHHPPFVAVTSDQYAGKHGSSLDMLKDIDSACQSAGVWPHAVFSAHAHNYQRFTRTMDNRETPYLVAGGGGHGVDKLTKKGEPALRTPATETELSNGNDQIVLENYDDQDYGYMRVIVDSKQLRIEYHPASDGPDAKTPDDSVTVDLATHKIVRYVPQQ